MNNSKNFKIQDRLLFLLYHGHPELVNNIAYEAEKMPIMVSCWFVLGQVNGIRTMTPIVTKLIDAGHDLAELADVFAA